MSTVSTTKKTTLTHSVAGRKALRGRRPWTAGFSLIELLTVIAIIAILAAFLFPVFGRVRESARQATCLSNLHDIYFQTRQFELDRHRYPDYLFGPALKADGTRAAVGETPVPIETVTGWLNHAPDSDPTKEWSLAKTAYLNSLYPAYIKSIATYHCPDNTVHDNVKDVTTAAVTRYQTSPAATTPADTDTYQAYLYDSYDANPMVADPQKGKLSTTVLPRYARLWTPTQATPPASAADGTHDVAVEYENQLYWKEPSGDTYITMCPYHADKSGKAMVLFLNGTAKAVDLMKLKNSVFNGTEFDTYKLLPTD